GRRFASAGAFFSTSPEILKPIRRERRVANRRKQSTCRQSKRRLTAFKRPSRADAVLYTSTCPATNVFMPAASTSWTCTKTSGPPPSGTMKLDRLRRTLPRRQDRTIRLPVFRNLDGADAVEQVGCDVVRHHLAERRQRPVGVGAANGKTKRPGIDRRAAPGANDNLKFWVALRTPAQCRHVTGEGYLNFAGRLVAQERNRHIGEFKPAFVRAASGAPDELLLSLHRFLQGPGDRRDVEDRRLLDRHGIRRRLARLARLLRACRHRPRGRRGAEQRG